MGLRGVKNALGAGVQQVTAEEAAAQTGTNPIANQMLQSAAGAGPDSVKMTGTPAQQQGALKRVTQTLTARDAQNQAASDAGQGATVNAAAAQQSVALQTLAKTAPLLAERIKNNVLSKTPPPPTEGIQIDKAALTSKFGEAAATEAEALLRKRATQELTPEEMARLTTILKPGGGQLTLAELEGFVKDKSSLAPLEAAKELFGNLDPNSLSLGQLTDADAQKLGFQNLADLELSVRSITGKSLAETKLGELEQAATQYVAQNGKDVSKLRQSLQDPTVSAAEKRFALEQLKQLGYENVLTEQARQGDIAKQIASGDSVRVGGVTVSVQELTNSPEILAKIAPALVEGPAGEQALEDLREIDPQLADWAEKNKAALEPYVQRFQTDIDNLQKVQDEKLKAFGGQELLGDPAFASILKNANIDVNAIDGKTVDPASIPEPARSIIAVHRSAEEPGISLAERGRRLDNAKRRAAIYQELYDSPLKGRATDPKLLETLASLPQEAVASYIRLESTSDAIYDRINQGPAEVARLTRERDAINPKTRKVPAPFGGFMEVPTDAYTAAQRKLNAAKATVANGIGPGIGVNPAIVTPSLKFMTSPALSPTQKASILSKVGIAGNDPAFASPQAFEAESRRLLKLAGNNQASLKDRIEAQARLDKLGQGLKLLDPNNENNKTLQKTYEVEQTKFVQTTFGTKAIRDNKPTIENLNKLLGTIVSTGVVPGLGSVAGSQLGADPKVFEQTADKADAAMRQLQGALAAAKKDPEKLKLYPAARAEVQKLEKLINDNKSKVDALRQIAHFKRHGQFIAGRPVPPEANAFVRNSNARASY